MTTEEDAQNVQRAWRERNPAKVKKTHKKWYAKPENKKKVAKILKDWRNTPNGRMSFWASQFRYFGKKLGVPSDDVEAHLAIVLEKFTSTGKMPSEIL